MLRRPCVVSSAPGWPRGQGVGLEIRWGKPRLGSNPSPGVADTRPTSRGSGLPTRRTSGVGLSVSECPTHTHASRDGGWPIRDWRAARPVAPQPTTQSFLCVWIFRICPNHVDLIRSELGIDGRGEWHSDSRAIHKQARPRDHNPVVRSVFHGNNV